MLPKDRSTTTSSKSATNKPPAASGPDTPIQFVKGVGPRLGAIFQSRDISTVKDLLHFFPRAYEDRSKMLGVSELQEGVKASVAVKVVSARQIPLRTGKRILEVRATDESSPISFKWFHAPRGMEARFQVGAQFIATGMVKIYQGRPEMVHPEITWGVSSDVTSDTESHNVGRVVPVYVEIEGVPSRTFRKILWEALAKFAGTLSEDLPERYLRAYSLPHLAQAVTTIHFPPESGDI
ncbi:MAG: hypothetical protein ACXVBW_05410, partial [Bdellovibrionota bacterium]